MGRRRMFLVTVALGLSLALVAVLLRARDAGRDEGRTAAAPLVRETPIPCLGGPADACVRRAARIRAERDHPVQVEHVSCSRAAAAATFVCNVQLPKTCDAYRVRYFRGTAFVRRPDSAYCIHVEVAAA